MHIITRKHSQKYANTVFGLHVRCLLCTAETIFKQRRITVFFSTRIKTLHNIIYYTVILKEFINFITLKLFINCNFD